MEVTVLDNLGVGCESVICVNVCLVAVESCALNSEVCCVENLEAAV